jgi:hypothetical protein
MRTDDDVDCSGKSQPWLPVIEPVPVTFFVTSVGLPV